MQIYVTSAVSIYRAKNKWDGLREISVILNEICELNNQRPLGRVSENVSSRSRRGAGVLQIQQKDLLRMAELHAQKWELHTITCMFRQISPAKLKGTSSGLWWQSFTLSSFMNLWWQWPGWVRDSCLESSFSRNLLCTSCAVIVCLFQSSCN